ncbi:MAG: orotidine 5'-phosphate decarboxylase, partial [Desulfurococcales archaeon]|nr:orotidine 5'-phosphate decarboxylase [Desulfurococcales archaeon]
MARVPGRLGRVIEECDAVLQVALDTGSLWEAFRIASLMPSDRRIVLEAGTPLIKSVGLYDAVGVLRGVAGWDRAVVADTKTVDAGGLEARSAGEAGADAMTVLSEAHEATIKEALEASEADGIAVYVDLILSRNPI